MKYIIIGIVGLIIGIGAFVYLDGKIGLPTGGFAGSILPLNASISSSVVIGPDEDNRVFASSTGRVYASIQSTGSGNVPVYCEASNDAPATASEGIALATSTSMLYEYTSDKGNLFGGSLRCTATASTTVLIQQYLFK